MRAVAALLTCALAAPAAHGTTVLRTVGWERDQVPVGAMPVPADREAGFARLRVENRSAQPLQLTLATLREPGVTTPFYAVRGQVRSEDVQGRAYLEMWSAFPDGGRYFSRTLATSGPMRALEGTAGWRPFVLPFQSRPGVAPPVELVVNLVLPGVGWVEVGPLELVEHTSADDLLTVPGQWFGGRAVGLVGGGFGALAGLLGALIGVLSARGAARRLVLGSMVALMAVGAIGLVLGLAALAVHQPREVWFSLLLPGALSLVIPAGLLQAIRQRYRELELRRMRALDAG